MLKMNSDELIDGMRSVVKKPAACKAIVMLDEFEVTINGTGQVLKGGRGDAVINYNQYFIVVDKDTFRESYQWTSLE